MLTQFLSERERPREVRSRAVVSAESNRETSGNDVGKQLVVELADLVLELELALLQPGELDLIMSRHRVQRIDRGIQIAMLLRQRFKAGLQFLVVHACDSQAFQRLERPLLAQHDSHVSGRMRRTVEPDSKAPTTWGGQLLDY